MDPIRTVTVPLEFPVEHEGTTFDSLTFRRMKAKDALVAEGEGNETRSGYLIFAALAGVDVAVIEELDVVDLQAVGEAVMPLMGKSAAAALVATKTAH